MSVLIQLEKQMVHELGFENMVLRVLVFWKYKKKK